MTKLSQSADTVQEAPRTAQWCPMICLTRLNHQPIVLNAEMIEYIEATPDTVIALTNGQRMTVLESPRQVVDRVIEYQRTIHQAPTASPGEEPAQREAES